MTAPLRRRLAALLLAAPIGALPAVVRAQAKERVAIPAIAARDSARPENIDRLLAVAYPEAMHDQLVEQQFRTLLRANPQLAQVEPAMRTFFTKHLNYAALRADQARVYRELFTDAEVQELTRFYSSDFGRRFVARMPYVTARSQEIVNQRLQSRLPELMGIISESMRTGQP
jgi:hypothetical protein